MKKISKKYIIGIDEVGRGPIAGPVSVGAFLVPVKTAKKIHKKLVGITDSKKLSAKKRETFFLDIKKLKDRGEINYAVSHVSANIIDKKGIKFALRTALSRSLNKLNANPKESFIFLDGGLYAPEEYPQETVIKGDQKIWQISAASIIAKVTRDSLMVKMSKKYPDYLFQNNKGYGTKSHYQAIKKGGTTRFHRKTWIKN